MCAAPNRDLHIVSCINNQIITLYAGTRGKVISSVVVVTVIIVSTKIARSQDVGILASGQCCQDVINGEIATSLSF